MVQVCFFNVIFRQLTHFFIQPLIIQQYLHLNVQPCNIQMVTGPNNSIVNCRLGTRYVFLIFFFLSTNTFFSIQAFNNTEWYLHLHHVVVYILTMSCQVTTTIVQHLTTAMCVSRSPLVHFFPHFLNPTNDYLQIDCE